MSLLHKRQGFTLIELLVCLAVITVLALITIPLGSSGRRQAEAAACVSNLRQIGAAANLYMVDHAGKYPPLPASSGSNGWYSYTIWGTPGGVRQWLYMGKLVEEGYISDGRVFYCPTSIRGTFDYDSQWGRNVDGVQVRNPFRIGYLQRLADNAVVPGELPAVGEHPYILMTDNFLARDYSQHALVPSASLGARAIHMVYSDGRVDVDNTGTRWGAAPSGALYDQWEKKH